MFKKTLTLNLLLFFSVITYSQELVSSQSTSGSVPLTNYSIYIDSNDIELVKISAKLLQEDIEMVTGKKPRLIHTLTKNDQNIIAVGTITHSSLLKKLTTQKKLSLQSIQGKWEAYQITSVKQNNQNILVIAGNDRRGTAFGVFELSKKIGVSPWYWWADVPVKKSGSLYINTNTKITDSPKVKYRGIFINDEAPALSNWSREKFGGFNHRFYEKVFELMLRLKSNYIWPAMWGNAFYHDDSLNIKSADKYGIVIGTSHHEPLMRAHEEWKYYNGGKWNYDSNKTTLQAFWRGGMQRATNEKIVTIGMRGDGDEPMTRETATSLLERIVKDQRTIIEEATNKPAAQTPQIWALYKEVQDYYDKGMRVPDDVTLLLCDDNWGNIRKLPKPNEKPRKGGYGIYYHFDYVGGPRNYKWINTNALPRVWEQMHMAWEYNARQIWIVNVGDIKPMELPISFFLDYAWDPEKITGDDITAYTDSWAAAQFGPEHAKEIGQILSTYSKFNSRRKPELLDQHTYSLENYSEAYRVTEAWKELLAETNRINDQLPAKYKEAYFQLVLHPVSASANLQQLYTTVALNHLAYKNKDGKTNQLAEEAKALYKNDSLITLQYHQSGNGKWNHMMSQTHIGYTYWQQPEKQKMPDVFYLAADSIIPAKPVLVSDEASANGKKTDRPVFYEQEFAGVSIEAAHYTSAVNTKDAFWKILPNHGRTGDGITIFPVTAPSVIPADNTPHLMYDFYSLNKGNITVHAYFSPTLNFHNKEEGLRYGISVNNETPQLISINKEVNDESVWNNWVANNIIVKKSIHIVAANGKNSLKFWMVDPGVVLQKIVIDFGSTKHSYLGPPETMIK